MSTIPKIWFLRHGQTEWNAIGRIQGQLDSPLTAQGRADAVRQAALIAPFVPAVVAGTGGVFVSPLGRAQETARIALEGYPFETDPRLAEIGTGAWEGRLRSEITPGATDVKTYISAPGGEGREALEGRVREVLASLPGPSILVSHGILGKILRGMVCGLGRAATDALSNRQGCVYVLENGRERVLD